MLELIIFILSRRDRDKLIETYYFLGKNGKWSACARYFIAAIELIIAAAAALCMGLILLLIWHAVAYKFLNINTQPAGFDAVEARNGLIVLVLAVILEGVFSRVYRSAARKNEDKRFKGKIFLWDKRDCIAVVLIALQCAVIIGVVALAFSYGNRYLKLSVYEEASGKMPADYDFELIENTPGLSAGDGGIYWDYQYGHDALSSEFISELSKTDGVEHVYAYKEIINSNIIFDRSEIDDYIDASDFFADGTYSDPDSSIGGAKSLFYDENEILVNVLIRSFPNERLKEFIDKYKEKYEIDEASVLNGDAVIVVAASFALYIGDNGMNMKDKLAGDSSRSSKYEKIYRNTAIKKEDSILISRIEGSDHSLGVKTKEELGEYYTRKNIYAKVGGVVSEYAGWFEREAKFGDTYEIIMSESAMERMFPNTEYSRATYIQTHILIMRRSRRSSKITLKNIRMSSAMTAGRHFRIIGL